MGPGPRSVNWVKLTAAQFQMVPRKLPEYPTFADDGDVLVHQIRVFRYFQM